MWRYRVIKLARPRSRRLILKALLISLPTRNVRPLQSFCCYRDLNLLLSLMKRSGQLASVCLNNWGVLRLSVESWLKIHWTLAEFVSTCFVHWNLRPVGLGFGNHCVVVQISLKCICVIYILIFLMKQNFICLITVN